MDLLEGYRISVQLGVPPRDVPTFWTVALGLLSGQPMTASEAAEILSVPRASVQRHISELEKLGFVITERRGNRLLLHSTVWADDKFSSAVNKFIETKHHSY
jgi:DNA-binding transcriptional ArsR family regulator